MNADQCVHQLGQVGNAFGLRIQCFPELSQHIVDQHLNEALFVFEMIIKGAFAHIGAFGDIVNSG